MLLAKQSASRWPARLGLLAMLGLAWHCYLERAACYDLAYHVFTCVARVPVIIFGHPLAIFPFLFVEPTTACCYWVWARTDTARRSFRPAPTGPAATPSTQISLFSKDYRDWPVRQRLPVEVSQPGWANKKNVTLNKVKRLRRRRLTTLLHNLDYPAKSSEALPLAERPSLGQATPLKKPRQWAKLFVILQKAG